MSQVSPCESYAEDWSAYLDGELAAEREALLPAHQPDCEVCTRRLEALRAADSVLRSELGALEVPSDLRARVQARIDADTVTSLATVREQRGLLTRLRAPIGAGLLAAAAAAAVYLAVSRETPLTPHTEPAERRVAVQSIEPPPPTVPESVGIPETPLDAASEEELAVALELETIEDLDVIANLDLLEALLLIEEGTG